MANYNKFDTSVPVDKNALPPYYKFVMPKKMADCYLKSREGKERNIPWREYLAKIVNTEFGLRGTCVELSVED